MWFNQMSAIGNGPAVCNNRAARANVMGVIVEWMAL